MSGRITPETAAEINNFEGEITRFLAGELAEERFRAFRLSHGVYGQRQDGVQMVRVKIPSGALDGRQLHRLAEISEQFGHGKSHLTTRQDIQFHFVQLERTPELMRRLAEVGLSTREACGNSVRNVTACPLSGYIAEEQFDIRPYSLGTFQFLIRNPFCQQLARKFKIAFSACPEDCMATAIHDRGALGRILGEGRRARHGFKVVVGGGLGATPFTAQVLDEFVPVEEFLPLIKAILKVASQHGNRSSKMKARLKFVVHKVGIDAFRELVAEERSSLTERELQEADIRRYVPDQFASLLARHLSGSTPSNVIPFPGRHEQQAEEDPEFALWRSTSVRAHKNPQRAVVTVMIPLGDLGAPVLHALADLTTAYSRDHARVAIDQNMVLPDVDRANVRALYEGLLACGLAEAGAGTALDVTSCPGADTCNLGITSSKGLTRAIRSRISPAGVAGNGNGLEALKGLSIKISGCPNSCGQHHIAGIGFHGVVKKNGRRQLPAYQLHLGGRVGHGEAEIGKAIYKVAAKKVPEVVSVLLDLYKKEKRQDESFVELIARVPKETLDGALEPFLQTSADPLPEDHFVDWDQTGPYTTDDLGVGECAGAGTDAADEPFDNYEAELLQAFHFMRQGQWVDAVANLNRSQYTLARVLLKEIGKHPESDYECRCELRAHVIDRGQAGELWNQYHEVIEQLLRTRNPDPRDVEATYVMSHALLQESKATWRQLAQREKTSGPVEVPG